MSSCPHLSLKVYENRIKTFFPSAKSKLTEWKGPGNEADRWLVRIGAGNRGNDTGGLGEIEDSLFPKHRILNEMKNRNLKNLYRHGTPSNMKGAVFWPVEKKSVFICKWRIC